jgi:hypothetical protein
VSTRPGLIGRDFSIDVDQPAALDARWCGDIAYIHTWQGWLYLATAIDLAPAGSSASPWLATRAPTSSPTL